MDLKGPSTLETPSETSQDPFGTHFGTLFGTLLEGLWDLWSYALTAHPQVACLKGIWPPHGL